MFLPRKRTELFPANIPSIIPCRGPGPAPAFPASPDGSKVQLEPTAELQERFGNLPELGNAAWNGGVPPKKTPILFQKFKATKIPHFPGDVALPSHIWIISPLHIWIQVLPRNNFPSPRQMFVNSLVSGGEGRSQKSTKTGAEQMEKSPKDPQQRQLGAAQSGFWQRLGEKPPTNPELRGSAGIPRSSRGRGGNSGLSGVGWGEGKTFPRHQNPSAAAGDEFNSGSGSSLWFGVCSLKLFTHPGTPNMKTNQGLGSLDVGTALITQGVFPV